ncbi:hypothetical protein OG21DRAFT_1483358 [Imleria badia]|nr:hypothetical protein OG21DRAFT_1483358 [Imleria badia]
MPGAATYRRQADGVDDDGGKKQVEGEAAEEADTRQGKEFEARKDVIDPTPIMDVYTNTCASEMYHPNGSYVTGMAPLAWVETLAPWKNRAGSGTYDDASYQDYDGTKSIRILNLCTDADDFASP